MSKRMRFAVAMADICLMLCAFEAFASYSRTDSLWTLFAAWILVSVRDGFLKAWWEDSADV